MLDGWDAFGIDDLFRVLCGGRGLKGYYNLNRRISLASLGMDAPGSSVPLIELPSDFLQEYHERRLSHYRDQRLVLWHPDVGYIQKSMVVRGTPAYNARVGDTWDDLRDFIQDRGIPCVFLTLSQRAEIGQSPLDSLQNMKGIINNLLSWIQTPSVLGFRPPYVWAIEPTKRGHCHYHIILLGIDYLAPRDLIGVWWERCGLGDVHGVYVSGIRDYNESAKLVVSYVTKYLNKPNQDGRWAGLLSLTNRRSWGMSYHLRAMLRDFKNERAASEDAAAVLSCRGPTNSNSVPWTCLGTFSTLECETFINGTTSPPDLLTDEVRSVRGLVYAINTGKIHFETDKRGRGKGGGSFYNT